MTKTPTFDLRIDLSGDAFHGACAGTLNAGPEIAAILRNLARRLDHMGDTIPTQWNERDSNGNTCAVARFTTSPDHQIDADEADRATILAALRFYQEQGMGNPANRSDAIHDIATNGDTVISLDADGIDQLCEEINADDTQDEADRRAYQERKQRFQDAQRRVQDDPDFADAYEADRAEGF